VQREVPVTVPKAQQAASRFGRYILADQYLRFYFRFIWPNQGLLEQGLHDRLWELISEQLRAYVGQAAFEELSRAWVLAQARAGQLSFLPEQVGAHWSANVQVDVAAINWRERRLLLGECKWGTEPIGRTIIRELLDEKTPKVRTALPNDGSDWTIDYVFFARSGFTEPARADAQAVNAMLIDLLGLDRGLQRA
jgi:AAA+ ATPase superfamily predicted ATPase